MNGTALLLHRERGHPDWDKAILAEGKTEARMTRGLQEEVPVAARVGELPFRWTAQGYAIENERAGIEGELLSSSLPLLADEGHRLDLPEPELGNPNGGQNRLKSSKGAL